MDIISELKSKGLELIPEGKKLRVRGQLTDEDRKLIRQHKFEILKALATPRVGDCESCRASGYWDYREYTGKRLCFYKGVFLGKPGKPVPCDIARLNCPLKGEK